MERIIDFFRGRVHKSLVIMPTKFGEIWT